MKTALKNIEVEAFYDFSKFKSEYRIFDGTHPLAWYSSDMLCPKFINYVPFCREMNGLSENI